MGKTAVYCNVFARLRANFLSVCQEKCPMVDVTFFSDHFSLTPAPDSINEMLGRDLAVWLHDALVRDGFEVGEVIAEDYGFGFWLVLNRSHYWLTAQSYEGDETVQAAPPQWLIGIHYDPGCLNWWRLRMRPNEDDLDVIAGGVNAALEEADHVTAIEWWVDGVDAVPPPT